MAPASVSAVELASKCRMLNPPARPRTPSEVYTGRWDVVAEPSPGTNLQGQQVACQLLRANTHAGRNRDGTTQLAATYACGVSPINTCASREESTFTAAVVMGIWLTLVSTSHPWRTSPEKNGCAGFRPVTSTPSHGTVAVTLASSRRSLDRVPIARCCGVSFKRRPLSAKRWRHATSPPRLQRTPSMRSNPSCMGTASSRIWWHAYAHDASEQRGTG